MTPELFNPYPKKKDSEVKTLRLCVDPPKEDVFAIRSVLMDFGAIHAAESMFLKHLANYVRTHNLTVADRPKLISHICSLFPDVTPRPAPSGFDGTQPSRDERRGTESVHSTGEGTQDKPAAKLRKQKTP